MTPPPLPDHLISHKRPSFSEIKLHFRRSFFSTTGKITFWLAAMFSLSLLLTGNPYWPHSILLSLPATLPLFRKDLFETGALSNFGGYLLIMVVFIGMVIATVPPMGTIAFLIFGLVIIFSWLWTALVIRDKVYINKEELEERMEEKKQQRAATTPRNKKALKEQIHAKIRTLDKEIVKYERKVNQYDGVLEKSKHFLSRIYTQLTDPVIDGANRATSLKLKDSLENSIQNQELLSEFFEEVLYKYQREKRNLELKLENLEIIEFLSDQGETDDLVDMEQAVLNLEFKRELKQIEESLPLLDYKMEGNAQLLSEDLKEQLYQTVERLRNA